MATDTGTPEAERLSIRRVDPQALRTVAGLDRHVATGTLDAGLLALVRVRASQLNGCAFCLDLHAGEARAAGVSQRQLDVLAAHPETGSVFDDRQLAALSLTDAVTRLDRGGVPDAVWRRTTDHFDDAEIVGLLMAIVAVNAWNRLAITTRQALPGSAPGETASSPGGAPGHGARPAPAGDRGVWRR